MKWEWDGANVPAGPQQQPEGLESSAWQPGSVVAEWLGRLSTTKPGTTCV